MAHTIWKYPLKSRGLTTLQMPARARVLSVQAQYETVTLWALVDPEAPPGLRAFHAVMTGDVAPEDTTTFLGTLQLFGGGFVAHLFEVAPEAR